MTDSIPQNHAQDPAKLSLDQVQQHTGYTKATIKQLLAEGKFPEPVGLEPMEFDRADILAYRRQ